MALDRRSIKDLLYCVEGLGRLQDDESDPTGQKTVYLKGIDCIICVQDLQRFLRRDDEKRKISEQLGKWNVVKNHLIPLLGLHAEDPDMSFEIIKLLVMMTLPANPKSSNLEDQLQTLQSIKENFVLPNPNVQLLMSILVEPLAKTEEERSRNDIELIELMLALFKNLLAIPDPPVTNNAQNSSRFHLQDDFIETLKKEAVLKLYLVLAQNVEAENNRTMNVLLLETFYLLFRREDPHEIVDTWYNFQKRAHGEKTTALGQKLANLRETAALARALSPVASSVRHSRFGGSFVTQVDESVKKVHLTTVDKLVTRKVDLNPVAPVLRGRRPPVEKKPVSGLECKITLKEFADSVLQHCYNELMGSIRDDMIAGNDYLVESDFENFYWVMGFFTAYHAHVFRAALADWESKMRRSGSLSASGSQKLSMSQVSIYSDQPGPKPVFDMSYLKATLDDNTFLFLADKIAEYKQAKLYTRMSIAAKALKELLSSLAAMYSSQESEENRRNAEIILLKLVYDPEAFLDRLVALVKVFTPAKMPLSSLANAVECVHYLLKLLEANSKQLVQRKKRVGRATGDNNLEGDDEDDGAHLDHYEEDGLAPEGDVAATGAPGAPGASGDSAQGASDTNPHLKPIPKRAEAKQRDADEAAAAREKYFDFQGYLAHFGKYSVVKNYVILLRNYSRNGPRLNHVVVKYFHRIIHTLKLETLLFQVSILRIFDAISNDMSIALKSEFSELRQLSEDISGRVVAMFQQNPSALAVQMLFPKTKYEAELLMRAKMIMEEEAELNNARGAAAEAMETDDLEFRGSAAASEATEAATTRSKTKQSQKRQLIVEEDDSLRATADNENDWDLGGMIENEREAALARLAKQREVAEEKRRAAAAAEAEKMRQEQEEQQQGDESSSESSLEFEEMVQEIEEEIEAEEEALAAWTDDQDEELRSAFDIYKDLLDDPDVNLWEALSTSVGNNMSAWQCYRRLQQLGVSLPIAIAPPEMDRRIVKRKQKTMRKISVAKKKQRTKVPKPKVSKQADAERGTNSANDTTGKAASAPEAAEDEENRKSEKVGKKKTQTQPNPVKKPRKKRAVAKELEDFIIDDYGNDEADPKKKEDSKKNGKKNAKKRGRDDSDEEEVVSHISDEEDDDENGKKSKKTKKNGRKRQKTGEESLADQLRMGAFQKDNEEADDDDLTVRFVPRRGRLQKQREPEAHAPDANQMDLELEIPEDDTPMSIIASPTKKSGGRRAAIVEDDENDAAPAKPSAPGRLNLRYDTQKDDDDRMELDIPEDDSTSIPPPTSSASQSGKKAGRRVIDDDDE